MGDSHLFLYLNEGTKGHENCRQGHELFLRSTNGYGIVSNVMFIDILKQ